MDARTFRDGALGDDSVALDRLQETISSLADGEWVWVDGVDPSEEEIDLLRKQLDLHELVVEDIHHRGQRPKVEIYGPHVFAALRPISLAEGELVEAELFLIASDRSLVTINCAWASDAAALCPDVSRPGTPP